MSDKHTPAPWAHINPDGFTVRHPQVYSDTGPVCNVTWLGDGRIDELRANARLIAAAPELLEALQSIIDSADKGHAAILCPLAAAARAAITKATGGAS